MIAKPIYEKQLGKWAIWETPNKPHYFYCWQTANSFYLLNKAREDAAEQKRRKEEEYE